MFVITLFVATLISAAPRPEGIFDILEEETSVMLSSRRKESAALAASMITVVDRELIERQGARYLHQILTAVVGFTVTRTEQNTWRVGLRGYNSDANFLVMVDGQRLNDAYDGAVPWDYPLANVYRIEIIRGPGSAVYGTNAFVGVINMITFDEREGDGCPGTGVGIRQR